MANHTSQNHQSLKNALRRLAPPLAFMFALCILLICCYDSGYSGLLPTEKRYIAAKVGINNLKRDENKNKLREPWEKLAAEFQSIYDSDPAWPNRPAALFRAAESLEELTRRSCSKADARKAIACYEAVALRHASSRLADDALFRAASLRATWLRDEKGALSLLGRLKKQYPTGDMITKAEALEKAINASVNGKTAAIELREAADASPIQEDIGADTGKTSRNEFSGDLPLRYRAAKSKMASLRQDNTRSCWRQSWEELREEFLKIHKSGKNRLSPLALYNAAACQDILAQCSRLSSDRKAALELYLQVHKSYPAHSLADDALLNAARIYSLSPSGKLKAIELADMILKNYPKGDMVSDAKQFRSLLINDGQKILAELPVPTKKAVNTDSRKPELQVLSWDSPNKNSVRIVLEMSEPVKFTTRLEEKSKGQPAKLFLDLANASIINDVRKGVSVQGSLLKAVRVRSSSESSILQFDFRDVKKFEAVSEENPCRIILSVAAGKTALPAKDIRGSRVATSREVKTTAAATQVSNMASQLGLTVQKVFIDAGHGGKDPGTNHNKIFEKNITMDVALTLGALLQANGLDVVYSRSKDRSVPLSERPRLANAAKADLFVSIHVNANEHAAANGFETYYLDIATTPQAAKVAMLENASSDKRLGDMQKMVADIMLNARADESKRLASDIQRLSLFRLKKRDFQTRNNGVKSAPFLVLCGAQMPAVLVEVGYCSNPDEARNLANPRYRHALAEGLAEGILAYKDRLLRNHTAGNILTNKKDNAI